MSVPAAVAYSNMKTTLLNALGQNLSIQRQVLVSFVIPARNEEQGNRMS